MIECSSYQIDLAPSIDPTVGIMLNVTPDHIDRHGTIEHYAAVKSRVLGRAKFRIIGVDDDYGRGMAKNLAAMQRPIIPISIKGIVPHGYVGGEKNIYRTGASEAEDIADLTGIGSLRGSHNMQNAVAAVAACSALGVDDKTLQEGLRSFPGLAHRMEQIGRKGAVLFINDSKATNADSAAKALASFDGIYWIAGGKPKEGGITSLAEFFPRIRKAYLIGEAAQDFANTLAGRVPSEVVGTLDAAVAAAARDARPAASPAWCCCRRPAPRSISSRISRCGGSGFGELVKAAALRHPREAGHPDGMGPRFRGDKSANRQRDFVNQT